MIWNQIKASMLHGKRRVKLKDVKDLMIQGIKNVDRTEKRMRFMHANVKEKEMWRISGPYDEDCENQNLIISIISNLSDSG